MAEADEVAELRALLNDREQGPFLLGNTPSKHRDLAPNSVIQRFSEARASEQRWSGDEQTRTRCWAIRRRDERARLPYLSPIAKSKSWPPIKSFSERAGERTDAGAGTRGHLSGDERTRPRRTRGRATGPTRARSPIPGDVRQRSHPSSVPYPFTFLFPFPFSYPFPSSSSPSSSPSPRLLR